MRNQKQHLIEAKGNIKVGAEITPEQAKAFYNRGYIDIVISNDKGEQVILPGFHNQETQTKDNPIYNLPKWDEVLKDAKTKLGDNLKFTTKSPDTNKTYYNKEREAGDEPEKTGIAYKLFKVIKGKLYPPMVKNPGNQDTPVGKWIECGVDEFVEISAGWGKPQVSGKNLSFRAGWHLGELPYAPQFESKKNPGYFSDSKFVWGECEYNATIDYQDRAMSYGYSKDGKYSHSGAGLPYRPMGGAYKYRTNPDPKTIPWVITGEMKVNRILSDAEVEKICKENNVPYLKRPGGEKTLAELGLAHINESVLNEYRTKATTSEITDNHILDLIKECINNLKSIGYQIDNDIQFIEGSRLHVFGTMYWPEKENGVFKLQLNKFMFKEPDEAIQNTIYHELAHYIEMKNEFEKNVVYWYTSNQLRYNKENYIKSRHSPHGSNWKSIAAKISRELNLPKEITPTDSYEFHTGVGEYAKSANKYTVKCTKCNNELHYNRKTEFVKNPNITKHDYYMQKYNQDLGHKQNPKDTVYYCPKCHARGAFEVIEND